MSDDLLFDPTTGEVLGGGPPADLGPGGAGHDEDGCHRCAAYRELAQRLQEDLDGEAKHNRALRRRIKALEEELKEARLEAPEAQTVRTIFAFWVRECGKHPKRTKLGEKREKAVLARLRNGYEPEYIMHAIRGAKVGCYVDPQTGQRYDDLELICRDEVHLERFYEKACRLIGPMPEPQLKRADV